MPSLIEGYEYDIFISYRQNDNRSGWVTEFVNSLQEELAATIKQPVSIYFDSNPHDGLLETHNVDKSLENKLKCLILIPILSQTYCDPNSFAWKHELCAFNQQAKADPLGSDIRLGNGNVASRILPIKIHDLDQADKEALERELGGVLRAVEFIFRSAGVNRSLAAYEDHPQDNLNKTFYRDQINKVANAIKEILAAIKNPSANRIEHVNRVESVSRPFRKNLAIAAAFVALLALSVTAYVFYGNGYKSESMVEDTQNSIAVLPFVNMSQDPEQEYFSDGITEQIITNLAHINSLKVIARTSVMRYKKTDKSIAEIGRELNVTHILEGSIRLSGDRIRVTAQLISSSDETHLWAQDYDRPLADIFTVQDEVSEAIARSLDRRLNPRNFASLKNQRPSNVEAYRHYLKAMYLHSDEFFIKRLKKDFLESESEFQAAVKLEPNYGLAYAGVADLYDTYRNFLASTREERLKFEARRDSCSAIAIRLSPHDPLVISVRAYTFSNKTDKSTADDDSAFVYMRRALALSQNSIFICDQLGAAYMGAGLYHQCIRLCEQMIGLDPTWSNSYSMLGFIYMLTGEYTKSEEFTRKALLLQPDGIGGLGNWALLQLRSGKLEEAERAIRRIKEVRPESDVRIYEAELFALKGDKERALSLMDTWQVRLTLGMKKEALDKMEMNQGIHYLFLKNSPFVDPLRQDARFAAILEKSRLVYEERLKKYAD